MINVQITRHPVPPDIGGFLTGPWFESVQLVLLKYGEDSSQWHEVTRLTQELMDTLNYEMKAPPKSNRQEGDGSIIVVVATNAPLLPHQLKRVAQRIPLGIGKVGGIGSNGSGDIFIAFSTANEHAFNREKTMAVERWSPFGDVWGIGSEILGFSCLATTKHHRIGN